MEQFFSRLLKINIKEKLGWVDNTHFKGYVYKSPAYYLHIFWKKVSLYYFRENVSRVLSWLPFLWKDRDYDYFYLLRLINYKLLRMKKEFETNQIVGKEVLCSIENTVEEFQKYLRGEFCKEEWEKHEKKWGELIPWKRETKEGCIAMIYQREKVTSFEADMEESKEARRLYKLEDRRRKATLKKALGLVEKHLETWWD